MMTEQNPNLALAPSVKAPAASAGAPDQAMAARMRRLESVLAAFEISIAEANDMVALEDFEIVVLCDDSGSMRLPAAPASQRTLGQQSRSRWEELKETVASMVEISCCFDASGIDVHFLNRAALSNVKSHTDPAFLRAFDQLPSGSTPLTESLQRVAQTTRGEKPVLLFIFTDGEPNGGKGPFIRALRELSTNPRLKIQIMACTSEESEIGWLNQVDAELATVDVTDDYYSERQEVLRVGLATKFTRGDWCMKAMLGPTSRKFDLWDERLGKKKVLEGTPGCDLCAVM